MNTRLRVNYLFIQLAVGLCQSSSTHVIAQCLTLLLTMLFLRQNKNKNIPLSLSALFAIFFIRFLKMEQWSGSFWGESYPFLFYQVLPSWLWIIGQYEFLVFLFRIDFDMVVHVHPQSNSYFSRGLGKGAVHLASREMEKSLAYLCSWVNPQSNLLYFGFLYLFLLNIPFFLSASFYYLDWVRCNIR